jgi:transmembrane sensor
LITAGSVIAYRLAPRPPPVVAPCSAPAARQQDPCKLATGQHSADYGETAALDLVDGSEIDLNANSQVTLDLDDHHRRIRLDRGEALFRVNKEHSTPFDVQVGTTTVRAVGTIFSIENKGTDRAETVVQEGKVLIFTNRHKPFLVMARQIAEVDGGRIQLRPPAQSNVDGRLSWTAGLVSFDGEPLEEAAEKFNRYNRRKLIVDPQIAQQPVAGLFRSTSPGEFADALEMLNIEHWVSRDSKTNEEVIYLRPKKSQRTAQEDIGDRNDFATDP